MEFLQAILLGIVQGLTEFLPISSSAHIKIIGQLIGTGTDPGASFTAIVQLGTELAVLIYFRKDIVRIVSQWLKSLRGTVPRSDPDARMGWLIIIGSAPIIVLGALFSQQIETVFRSLWIVATTLIVFAVLLGVADRIGAKKKELSDLSFSQGILYGLAQALALIPGVSRSGGTITAGLLMGYQRAAAARYSFLLAMPAVFGSGFYQLYKSMTVRCSGTSSYCVPEVFNGWQTAAATVVAFVVGYLVIAFLMSYISRHSFLPFVIYRLVLGSALLVALATGFISA